MDGYLDGRDVRPLGNDPAGRGADARAAALTIEGFDDLTEIGRGGFGVVFRAREVEFGRIVALKLLTIPLDDKGELRFKRERQAMGSLTGHPNIVTVFSSGRTLFGLPYLVMEFLPGGSLADRLPDHPYSWSEAIGLMVKAARAIGAAHDIGILHRDIKPENILLASTGEPKITDFGIARLHGLTATSTGVVTASVAHAAPEIMEGQAPSVASEVYSLGSTLFDLIAGMPPFVHETDESILPVISRLTRDPVPDLRPHGVPSPVCLAIERAMSKAPGDRHESAAALATALENATRIVTGGPGRPEAVPFSAEPLAPLPYGTARVSIGTDTPLADIELGQPYDPARVPPAGPRPPDPSVQLPALPPPQLRSPGEVSTSGDQVAPTPPVPTPPPAPTPPPQPTPADHAPSGSPLHLATPVQGTPPGATPSQGFAPGTGERTRAAINWVYVFSPVPVHDQARNVIANLVPGTWYALVAEERGWSEVLLPDGRAGWVDGRAIHRRH